MTENTRSVFVSFILLWLSEVSSSYALLVMPSTSQPDILFALAPGLRLTALSTVALPLCGPPMMPPLPTGSGAVILTFVATLRIIPPPCHPVMPPMREPI